MQLLKITFIAALAITLCSFAFHTTDGREQLLQDFLSEFKAYELPNTIKLEAIVEELEIQTKKQNNQEVSKKEQPRKILGAKYSTFIPEIEDGMISRMGPSTYEAEALLVSADHKFNTVIYSRSTGYGYNSKSFFLATFDKEGKEIATQYLGNARTNKTLELNSSKFMELTIKEFNKEEDKLVEASTKKMFVKPSGEIIEHVSEIKKQETELQQKTSKIKVG